MEDYLMNGPQLIAPGQIESELTRIWESLEGANKTRACLFNLIVYTEKNRRESYFHSVVQKVIEKFPSRVIFITADVEAKEGFLKTSVSVMSAGKGECDVACDLIQIEVSGEQQMRVPFLVLPHILPDLPVYLLWAEDPPHENPVTAQLEKLATRIIFDSESTTNLAQFAKTLLKHQESAHVDIADLNWARMESWRQLLSSSFYSAQALDQLKQAQKIQIKYNAHTTVSFSHTRIQAIYLQAWLACQLNWQLQTIRPDKDGLIFLYRSEKGSLEIALLSADYPKLAPGIIISLDMQTDHEHFSFARDPEVPNHIAINFSSRDKCLLPTQFIFAKAESGQSLVKEICHKGTSSHYLKVLTFISKMEALTLC